MDKQQIWMVFQDHHDDNTGHNYSFVFVCGKWGPGSR